MENVYIFDEALTKLALGDHDFDLHTFNLRLLEAGITPSVSDSNPQASSYLELPTVGSYTVGGKPMSLSVNNVSGVVTVSVASSISWTASILNVLPVRWGLITNQTTGAAFAFIDLNGLISVATSPLTFTWPSTGLFRYQQVWPT